MGLKKKKGGSRISWRELVYLYLSPVPSVSNNKSSGCKKKPRIWGTKGKAEEKGNKDLIPHYLKKWFAYNHMKFYID